MDLRVNQIISLICFSIIASFFSLSYSFSVTFAYILTCVMIQFLLMKFYKVTFASKWWMSSIISALSLGLLVRVDSILMIIPISFAAICSKFIFRFKDAHFFNPTNFALAISLLFFSGVWIDYGYWGSFNLWIIVPMIFSLPYFKKGVISTSLIFLVLYFATFAIRHVWLGDPWQVFLHQRLNVALMIFAFFMISDPRTVPRHIMAKLIFCSIVVVGTYYHEAILYKRSGLIIYLAFASLFTPILNYIFKKEEFLWHAKSY